MPVLQAKELNKLLVICGPTATGKTSLAISLAKKFGGGLISADSRQIYRGFDIGTGKDLPKNSRYQLSDSRLGGNWEVGGVPIWGYDLVGPKEQYSVARYLLFVQKVLPKIWSSGKLPILVGGTGLYIKGVVDGIPTAFVPKNRKLRVQLEGKSISELFENLAQIDPLKAGAMNSSDRKNPRRLIRAIEIAQWRLSGKETVERKAIPAASLMVGLTAPKERLYRVIAERVEKRLQEGLLREIKKLLTSGISWEDQAMTSLGYRQWQPYLEKKMSFRDAKNEWLKEETRYAARQMVWFKRDKRIKWFDITQKGFGEKVEKLVKKWYKGS